MYKINIKYIKGESMGTYGDLTHHWIDLLERNQYDNTDPKYTIEQFDLVDIFRIFTPSPSKTP